MAATLSDRNGAAFAWDATCERSSRFTRLEPVTSRRLLPIFSQWPRLLSASVDLAVDDLAAARIALGEAGDRQSYTDLRKELGL